VSVPQHSWLDLAWVGVALVMLLPLFIQLVQIVIAYPWRLMLS
jgi:hypothetical protein